MKIPVYYNTDELYYIACRCLINDFNDQMAEIADALKQLKIKMNL